MRRLILAAWLAVSACDSGSSPRPPPPAVIVDINHASLAELEALPEIGRAYAQKIVAGRPYDNKTQLRARGILPDRVYDRVAPLLTAHQK